jgi:RsiW-degrading membrane proteinase PrsW (M82 family)
LYCPNCGRPIETGAAFCAYCGRNLQDLGFGEATAHQIHPREAVKQRHSRSLTWLLVLLVIITGGYFLGGVSPDLELLFVLAIAPSAFLIWYFYHIDKYKHESTRLLLVTFTLGAVSIIPAGLIEFVISRVLPRGPDILSAFVYFLLGVALVEESFKFLSVRIYAFRSPHFDEPIDGIILGVAAALGFATIENIGYVFQYGVETAIIRGFLSVPAHAFWGAIIGFYLAEAKVKNDSSLAVRGLVLAIFFHAVFDTITFVIPNGLASLIILTAFVLLVYFQVVKKEIAEAERESPYGTWK